MSEILRESIVGITEENSSSSVVPEFLERIKEGKLIRDENPESHFCSYFAGYDPDAKKVFIGHHKKSGLWLFNGGHIDENESPIDTVKREMVEEWGVGVNIEKIGKPKLLTITSINQPNIACKKHYDIWYFVPLDEKTFNPDPKLMETEFYQAGWKTIEEAREVAVTQTLVALDEFEKIFKSRG